MPREEPKERLVSKGRYALHIATRLSVSTFGLYLLILGCIGTLLCVIGAVEAALGPAENKMTLLFPLFIALYTVLVAYAGYSLIKGVNTMESLAPITRDIVRRLPAMESLVRPASNDPVAEEQVLLRATAITDETPATELLRPHE